MFEGSTEGIRNIGVGIGSTLELSRGGWSSFLIESRGRIKLWWFNNNYSVFG